MSAGSGSNSVSADAELPSALTSATPDASLGHERLKRASRNVLSCFSLALPVAFGCLGLSPVLIALWGLWTKDPLRSIGMLIVCASILLTLRVWWHMSWELRGTWWGLLPVALAFSLNAFHQNVTWYWITGRMGLNFLPPSLSLYLYASGVLLLFAGARVWQQAWFPLALLLFAQPMPSVASQLVDLPLQQLSAHIARSFASFIGFPPTNPQLLKLMFTPDFGMFIAPGCDGLRGAVTLGYVALIVGYLKRVSIQRWFLYVSGAVLLGYVFNLIRLCALVLYYWIAVGHPALERVAKQVDYGIGGCMFLVATVLFLWAVTRKENNRNSIGTLSTHQTTANGDRQWLNYWKVAALAILALIFAVPGVHAIEDHQQSLAVSERIGELTPQQLDDLMPKELGDYKLNRAWQQQFDGATAVEGAAYAMNGSDEIILGVWLLPTPHSVHDSWMNRGEDPEMRTTKSFVTAQGRTISFDTAFYSDGVTDSLMGNAFCTPSSCSPSHDANGMHMAFTDSMDFTTRGIRAVPIFFRVETLHTDTPRGIIYDSLSAEVRRFLGSVDFAKLSQRFQ
jgi:exosortase J